MAKTDPMGASDVGPMRAGETAATWESVDTLVPWDQNPRVNDHAVADVAESIKRFGFAAPLVVRTQDRMVIAGHTRLLAAKSLGIDRVPVRFLDLDPADAKLLALADNKVGEVAYWDDSVLADVLAELKTTNEADIYLSGFDQGEVDALLGGWQDPFEQHLDGEIEDQGVARVTAVVPNTEAHKAMEIVSAALTGADIEFRITSS
tara:strand:- start:1224 stop:1838 length:615 start_codon:yes stop_codon:yes gene_type:complete